MPSCGARASSDLAVGECLAISCVTWIFHSILSAVSLCRSLMHRTVAIACLIRNEISNHTQFYYSRNAKIVRDQFLIMALWRAGKKRAKEKNLIENSLWITSSSASMRRQSAVSFDTNKAKELWHLYKGDVGEVDWIARNLIVNSFEIASRVKCVKCVRASSSGRVSVSGRPSAARWWTAAAEMMQCICCMVLCFVLNLWARSVSVLHFFLAQHKAILTGNLKALTVEDYFKKSNSANIYTNNVLHLISSFETHATCLAAPDLDLAWKNRSKLSECRIYFFIWWTESDGEH